MTGSGVTGPDLFMHAHGQVIRVHTPTHSLLSASAHLGIELQNSLRFLCQTETENLNRKVVIQLDKYSCTVQNKAVCHPHLYNITLSFLYIYI